MMTREEEILLSLEDVNPREIASHIEHGTLHQWIKSWKAATRESIIAALRPVSREQVEKAWRGEWVIQQDEHKEYIKRCSKCGFPISGWWGADKFCANCGEAFTDEAVEMVMERLERLRDE